MKVDLFLNCSYGSGRVWSMSWWVEMGRVKIQVTHGQLSPTPATIFGCFLQTLFFLRELIYIIIHQIY